MTADAAADAAALQLMLPGRLLLPAPASAVVGLLRGDCCSLQPRQQQQLAAACSKLNSPLWQFCLSYLAGCK